MNLRHLFLIVSAILLTGAVGFVAYVFWQFRDSPLSDGHHPNPGSFAAKLAEYERLIQSEVPMGSSVTQVEKFLTTHQIEHGSLYRGPAAFKRDSDFEKLRFPGKDQTLKSFIPARVRNAEHEGVIEWSLMMRFYFDEHDRLVTHTLGWSGTGP
ncbi:MAG: hypothetical protein JF614_20250 [Acidobacteria bacterium]|nr:hypothetical protein [Acidobacteriota bacterium]